MPWKLIAFIIILVLVAVFAALNISNRADISLGFHVFENVPIFLSLLITFLVGALVMVPFTIGPSRRKMRLRQEKKAEIEAEAIIPEGIQAEMPEFPEVPHIPELDEAPQRKNRKRKKKKNVDLPDENNQGTIA